MRLQVYNRELCIFAIIVTVHACANANFCPENSNIIIILGSVQPLRTIQQCNNIDDVVSIDHVT